MPEEATQDRGFAPALFQHCVTIYEAMVAESEEEVVEGEPIKVYQGFLTRLFEDKGLSTPYYTKIMGKLRHMDCVRQLSRGGGTAPSRWMLVQAPTSLAFQSDALPEYGSKASKMDELQQMLRDIQSQINDLSNNMTIVSAKFEEFERFKKRLEGLLDETFLTKLEA